MASFFIVAILAVILVHVAWHGREAFSLRFLTSGVGDDVFDPRTAGVFPMLIGTVAKVFLMTLLVLPVGVLTAIYLSEYTRPESRFARVIRSAVNNLAGVPSVVFGLFGLAFFVGVVGGSLDELSGRRGEPVWGRPALVWASFTLAVMTLPVVIVTTEEAFRSVPPGLREASFALGATRMQTVLRVVLPGALPGMFTGAILAISRAAGEVAPILFTGAAYYMPRLPASPTDQFMDLGYHAFVLATQTPHVDAVRPVLYATVLSLLALTLALNVVALLIRTRLRRGATAWQI
jgi:phosphate transport system permease protein